MHGSVWLQLAMSALVGRRQWVCRWQWGWPRRDLTPCDVPGQWKCIQPSALKLLLHKGKSGARYSSPLLPYFCVFQQFWREKKTSCKLVFCSTKYKCKSIHVGLSVSIIRTPTVRSDLSTYSSVLKTQGMLSYVLKSEGIVAIFSCKGKVFSIAIYACIPQTF